MAKIDITSNEFMESYVQMLKEQKSLDNEVLFYKRKLQKLENHLEKLKAKNKLKISNRK